jgi:ATP-dependent protease HslVU (ClpYQ) peptidase subunit
MTCIIGYKDKENVYMGGDRCISDTNSKDSNFHSKVFKKYNILFGFCGCLRIPQLIKYKFSPPDLKVGQDLDEYIYTDFIDTLINLLESNKSSYSNDNVASMDNETTIMVGIGNKLFCIEDNYQIIESSNNYYAIGNGREHAIGCLYGIDNTKLTIEKKILKALECSAEFSVGVRGPFDIINNK